MKILFLNYEYPPLGGGAGVCTKYEAEGLANLGHKVVVITTWFNGEQEYEKKGNLEIIRLKSKRKDVFKSDPLEMMSYAKQAKIFLSNYLKENKFDLCISNFTIPGGIVSIYLKKKFNLPYVIISHGHDIPWFLPQQMFLFHLATYSYIKNICKNAERLILLTKDMKENADKFLDKYTEKNIIIENGADLSKFFPNYKNKSKILKIIFVGRQREQKDPMTFLEAIKLFRENNPTIKFQVNVLGDGPLRSKMELFVKDNSLSEFVNFLGWVSKDKILEEYQSASVQIMPSLAEAMSVATLESLSTGLYIISTKVSGNTDVIVENVNGEFVPFKDAKAIEKSLKDFYENKLKSEYRVPEDVINNLKDKYSWDVIVNKYDNLIKEIVGE